MSITESHPELYRALMDAGWQYRDLRGGGGVFRVDGHGVRCAVQVKRGGAVEIWVNNVQWARFTPSAPPAVAAAAAVATTPRAETR